MRVLLFWVGLAIGMAVLLPLMLVFDGARPWLALTGVVAGALLYFWGRHQRARRAQ